MSAGRCVASITLAMVKVLPEPVTPSSTCVRSLRLTPSTSSRDRLRLVALRLEVGFDDEALAAFGFLRPRRAVRRPRHGGNFRPALAQQSLQRLRGGDAHRTSRARLRQVGARQAVFRIAAARDALGFAGGLRVRVGRGVAAQAQFLRQGRIEPGDRRRRIIALRRFARNLRAPTCAPCARRRNRRGGRTNCPAAAEARRCRNPGPRCPC